MRPHKFAIAVLLLGTFAVIPSPLLVQPRQTPTLKGWVTADSLFPAAPKWRSLYDACKPDTLAMKALRAILGFRAVQPTFLLPLYMNK